MSGLMDEGAEDGPPGREDEPRDGGRGRKYESSCRRADVDGGCEKIFG